MVINTPKASLQLPKNHTSAHSCQPQRHKQMPWNFYGDSAVKLVCGWGWNVAGGGSPPPPPLQASLQPAQGSEAAAFLLIPGPRWPRLAQVWVWLPLGFGGACLMLRTLDFFWVFLI